MKNDDGLIDAKSIKRTAEHFELFLSLQECQKIYDFSCRMCCCEEINPLTFGKLIALTIVYF